MITKSLAIKSAEQPPLPYGCQWVDEDDIAEVVAILRGDWMTQGPIIAAFEEALADYCGARYAVVVSNGTAALHLACLAASVGKGDVGITSPITFVASANCVAYCEGTPTFADVDETTITLDPLALEEVSERLRPKVIIPVDFTGLPADLPAISNIARKYGAVVIEDAAHSLGATYEYAGKEFRAASCSHADMAILSFHPVKHITTGEGGAILTNNDKFYQQLLELRTHGITKDISKLTRNDGPWYYEQQQLGFNYRITDFQCALGISQLKKLPAFIQRRRELVRLYQELMIDLEDRMSLLTDVPGKRSAYHLLVARFREGASVRRQVFDYLIERNIRAQVHYIPIHFQPWYQQQYGFREGDFPKAESYYSSCISLPLFPKMSDWDVVRVVSAIREALDKAI
jgi:UDP-4-amino-4,6-dideoxy-N-acetyl-beta-L-altrosamine transaminase